tara:strand:- start:16 stop:231 length:216 start_codon:yes stop_codon:yes gene_type:complete
MPWTIDRKTRTLFRFRIFTREYRIYLYSKKEYYEPIGELSPEFLKDLENLDEKRKETIAIHNEKIKSKGEN